jgi:CRISPR-associated exonuclease Cas4
MFAYPVPAGYIYHAASRRRREVLFDWRLRDQTERTIKAVRELLDSGLTPPAELKPRCDGCSLRRVCMPELFQLSPSGHPAGTLSQYLDLLYSSNWEGKGE